MIVKSMWKLQHGRKIVNRIRQSKKFAFQRQIGENMEKEIKIDLVPKEQINEDFDCVRITCENICVWANCLESAIKAFDEALRQHR